MLPLTRFHHPVLLSLFSALVTLGVLGLDSVPLQVLIILFPLVFPLLWGLKDPVRKKHFFLFAFIVSLGFAADIPLLESQRETAWMRLGVVYLSDITLICLCVATFSTARHHPKPIRNMPRDARLTFTLFAVFALWQTAGILFSQTPMLTALSSVQLLRGLLIILTLYLAVDTTEALEFTLVAFICIAFINGGWALLQQMNGGSFGLTHLGERARGMGQYQSFLIDQQVFKSYISGFIGQPYKLGAFLMALLPAIWAIVLSSTVYRRNRLFPALAIALSLAAIYLCHSKAIWTLTSLSLAGLVGILTLKQRLRPVYALLGLVLLGLVATMYADAILARFFHSNLDSSWQNRLHQFDAALTILENTQYIGSGFGASSASSTITIHSLYFLGLAESGFVGILLFVLFQLSALRLGLGQVWSGVKAFQPIALGLTLGITAIFLQGIVTWMFWRTELNSTVMGLIGILCALSKLSTKTAPALTQSRTPSNTCTGGSAPVTRRP